MNKKFNVINKKGLLLSALIMAANTGITAFSLGRILNGDGRIWLLPFIFFGTFLLFSVLIMMRVVSAGFEVRKNQVIVPDTDVRHGGNSVFDLHELESVNLCDGSGNQLDPEKDSLRGARVQFQLKDGRSVEYYPATITKKQFRTIESSINGLLTDLHNEDLFDDADTAE